MAHSNHKGVVKPIYSLKLAIMEKLQEWIFLNNFGKSTIEGKKLMVEFINSQEYKDWQTILALEKIYLKD